MTHIADLSTQARLRLIGVQGGALLVLLGGLLFGSAGTLAWERAWLLLAVYGVCFFVTSSVLFLRVPDVMDARRVKHAGIRRWDRLLVLGFQAMYFPAFVVSGLDERFGWSGVPPGVSLAGLALIVGYFAVATWAPLVNPHLETYVRIQADRGHRVIDGGPYRVVRHPTYAGLALFFVGIPLSLGSLWGLLPAVIAVALLIVRTTLEDRTLLAELDGYAAYAQRVRFRWIPGVW